MGYVYTVCEIKSEKLWFFAIEKRCQLLIIGKHSTYMIGDREDREESTIL